MGRPDENETCGTEERKRQQFLLNILQGAGGSATVTTIRSTSIFVPHAAGEAEHGARLSAGGVSSQSRPHAQVRTLVHGAVWHSALYHVHLHCMQSIWFIIDPFRISQNKEEKKEGDHKAQAQGEFLQ